MKLKRVYPVAELIHPAFLLALAVSGFKNSCCLGYPVSVASRGSSEALVERVAVFLSSLL